MRGAIESMFRFSWSMSLFGLRQMVNLVRDPRGETAIAAFAEVTRAVREQLAGPLEETFAQGERLQHGFVDGLFGGAPAAGDGGGTGDVAAPVADAGPRSPAVKVDPGRLDCSSLVVLGEGLAAGAGDFALTAAAQRWSFPAQLACQMQAVLPQPLLEAPGLGNLPGFPAQPVRLPGIFQSRVLASWPPPSSFRNLSFPGLTLAGAAALRPAPPLIWRHDALQTGANLVLGLPWFLSGGSGGGPTPLAAAVALRPTFTIVALGYHEALSAACAGEPGELPAAGEWRSRVDQLAAELRRGGSEIWFLTSPDPLDTAHFATVEAAGRVLRVDPAELCGAYGLDAGDRITLSGLMALAFQLLGGQPARLAAGSVMGAAAAADLGRRIDDLNESLTAAASARGCRVFDLHALFRAIRIHGAQVGRRRLSADFLGGFYSLNGYYPGRTGHALIAGELLRALNSVYGAAFPAIDLEAVAARDPVFSYEPPPGDALRSLPAFRPASLPVRQASLPAAGMASRCQAAPNGGPLRPTEEPAPRHLQLPPDLVEVLPIVPSSYHGDAIRVVNCDDPRDIQWGSGGDLFFGGHAMYASHLHGSVRIRFAPAVGDLTRFEVTHEGGLDAADGVLSAPWLFRWPVRQAQVLDDPRLVSSGTLNLATGEVTNLNYYVRYRNSALFGLVRANPHFPDQPIAFPGQYGSAWARFEQRPDGRLDFTFSGSTFLPLGGQLGGDPVRWALPFASGDLQFASIPAAGMVMHPHLFLTTREPGPAAGGFDEAFDLPENCIQEYTLFTRNSAFGDQFSLNAEELGGRAKGRSHILGRLEIQFGERFGDSLPALIACLEPGGALLPPLDTPLNADFPGKLYRGPMGHDEMLRFPRRSYFLDSVDFLDDPFDISVGAVDLRTGCFHAELLHRGLIGQNLFYALVRLEPRTPRSSFAFRGPARFERGTDGRSVFRFDGLVRVPYPDGFYFPSSDLATRFPVGPNSVLDPFLWLQARPSADGGDFCKQGAAKDLTASIGDRFSLRYSIPGDPPRRPAFFEYVNATQGATFSLTALTWVSFTNSRTSRSAPGQYDTVSFSGFGTWSKDGGRTAQLVTAQISDAPDLPYVSIQVGGGLISNVNTKPTDETFALP